MNDPAASTLSGSSAASCVPATGMHGVRDRRGERSGSATCSIIPGSCRCYSSRLTTGSVSTASTASTAEYYYVRNGGIHNAFTSGVAEPGGQGSGVRRLLLRSGQPQEQLRAPEPEPSVYAGKRDYGAGASLQRPAGHRSEVRILTLAKADPRSASPATGAAWRRPGKRPPPRSRSHPPPLV